MKSHTSEFKEEIKTLGKQQSVRITYTLNNEQIILTDEDVNSATPNYEASLLKSVMKSLVLDSNKDIPLRTEINFKYGLLVNEEYEYLDYLLTRLIYNKVDKEEVRTYLLEKYELYPETCNDMIKFICDMLTDNDEGLYYCSTLI